MGSSYPRMSLNQIFSMVAYHNTHVFPHIKYGYMIAFSVMGAIKLVDGGNHVKIHIGNKTYTDGPFSRAVLGGALGYMTGVALAYTYPITMPLAIYGALGGYFEFRTK
jgi:hypothetical protein